MGKFLDFFKIDDEEFEEIDEPETQTRPSFTQQREEEEEEQPKSRILRSSKPKVVPMQSSRAVMEVNVIKPSAFEDSQEICNTLLQGKPVVVNLEGFDPDEAQRIMDFITGCIYAIDGKFNQISKYIFIFTPSNVDISGDSLSFTSDGFAQVPTINKDF